MIHLVTTDLMAHRLTNETTISWRVPKNPPTNPIRDETSGENDLFRRSVNYWCLPCGELRGV